MSTKKDLFKKVTGFVKPEKKVSLKKGDRFLFAYCIEKGDDISPWFTTQGTFSACHAAYITMQSIIDYQNENFDLKFLPYTIWYQLNVDESEVINTVDEIEFKKGERKVTLRDLIYIDSHIPLFEIKDYLE